MKQPPSGEITVHARSFESLATDTTELRFPPPLADRGSNPSGFEFWWKMMEFVFALPPPDTFPPFPKPPREQEREVLERFVRAAEELAESSLLSSSDSVTVHVPDEPDGVERIEASFQSNEITRGFVVLFRQLHTSEKSDPARFIRVREILKQINARAGDSHVEERNRQIDAWSQARGRLLGENLRVRVGQKLSDEGRWPADGIPGEGGLSPQALITGYQYGDLIHWGYGRDVVEAVANNPFRQAWQRMAFLEAVTGLSHVYLGFSLVLVKALSEATG
jgi:hypothetical protein